LFPMSHASPESTIDPPHKRGLIHRVLEPALQLWLRSQVESVSSLTVHLEGGDRQILSGYLPLVQLNAQNVVYRGLHLSQIELSGHNFKINIGQILKGKALRLLEPISIDLNVGLDAADAQASLHSELLQAAIVDALQLLVGEQISDAIGPEIDPEDLMLQDPNLSLSDNSLRFSAELRTCDGNKSVPVALQTSLSLDNPHTLTLDRPEWLPTRNAKRGLPLHDLHGYTFDLGPQAQIQSLRIAPEAIVVQGQMTVLPEA
jgi:LmeA-like phospholipid-binding